MALTDPQSITINGVTTSLPRVDSGNRRAVYQSNDGTLVLSIFHQLGKRSRSTVRLNNSRVAADPMNPATNRPYSMSTYLVIDSPLNIGYTDAELEHYTKGLTGLVNGAGFLPKILGGES